MLKLREIYGGRGDEESQLSVGAAVSLVEVVVSKVVIIVYS
jgi:hypothetical protein